ncbi:MAG: AIR synthase-related protein [Candidatus Aminicenantaceae bacterium]
MSKTRQAQKPNSYLKMFRTFNMGIGYVMVVGKSDVQKIIRKRKLLGEDAFVIGQIGAGRGGVQYIQP